MSVRRVAIFGQSFNPPKAYVREVIIKLSETFDLIIVIPCGPRPDKPWTSDIDPLHRAALVDMTCRGLPKTQVELFDLENPMFTHTVELERMFSHLGQIWHVVSIADIKGGATNQSSIQRTWDCGTELWCNSRFVVMVAPNDSCDPADLPPHHEMVERPPDVRSGPVADLVRRRESIAGLVMPEVEAYIERLDLYRRPRVQSRLTLDEPRALIITNPERRAADLEARFASVRVTKDPNCIVVLGGDGTMLHAIRDHWRQRLPFIGVNAGTIGALQNQPEEIPSNLFTFFADLDVYTSSLFHVEFVTAECEIITEFAFNDAWMEKLDTMSTARLRVCRNEEVLIPEMGGDGFLCATAAGYDGYARSMGAQSIRLGDSGFVMVAKLPHHPFRWFSDYGNQFDTVTVQSLARYRDEPAPILGFIDGRRHANIVEMRVRLSPIAAAELAFIHGHDLKKRRDQSAPHVLY